MRLRKSDVSTKRQLLSMGRTVDAITGLPTVLTTGGSWPDWRVLATSGVGLVLSIQPVAVLLATRATVTSDILVYERPFCHNTSLTAPYGKNRLTGQHFNLEFVREGGHEGHEKLSFLSVPMPARRGKKECDGCIVATTMPFLGPNHPRKSASLSAFPGSCCSVAAIIQCRQKLPHKSPYAGFARKQKII